MITVTIHRKSLQDAGACADGLALFSRIAAMQPETDSRRQDRIRVRWTRLHRVWLAAAYPSFWWWLYGNGFVPESCLSGADMRGANLRSANLYGADMRSANLYGADMRSANLYGADLGGADMRGANLGGANLYGADMRSADLGGADMRGANLGDYERDPESGFARRKSS